MKLYELTCPNCGAHLDVDDSCARLSCSYCGTLLLVDRGPLEIRLVNAEEAGFDFERGRQRARRRWLVPVFSGFIALATLCGVVAIAISSEKTVPAPVSGDSDTSPEQIVPVAPEPEPSVVDSLPGNSAVPSEQVTPIDSVPDPSPSESDSNETANPASGTEDQSSSGDSVEQIPSPLYVFVRTSQAEGGGIIWHFTFSNHGTEPITQIILDWVALDAEGNVLDNPTTNFNLFEKGWNITGSPLSPGYALPEVSPKDPTTGNPLVFSNPDYHETKLMMVAITFSSGQQVILDNRYIDVSNVCFELGDIIPGFNDFS